MNEWWKDAIVYHIFPMGFCGAPHMNDFHSPAEHRIRKIADHAGKIRDLGCDTVLLGPVFESSSHGYDTVDFYNIDRRLGNNRSFAETVNELKHSGLRVVLDGVFHHTGRDFWAFHNLRTKRESSPYRDWFSGINFRKRSSSGDPFSYDNWEGHDNLVKLNLNNPEVKNHIFKAVEEWLIDWGIDGLRLDTAYCLDREFLTALSVFCKKLKPDFWLMGEIIHGDYKNLADGGKLDSVTNYECYKGLYSSHNDRNYFEIAYSLNRQFGNGGIYDKIHLYNFADNHDVSRLATILHDEAWLKPLYALLFTMPGTPSVYYGSENGMTGGKIKGSDWNLRPSAEELPKEDTPLFGIIKRLSELRKKHNPLRRGRYEQLHISHQQFAFAREDEGDRIVTAVNAENRESEIPLHDGCGRQYADLLTGETFASSVKIPPGNFRILRCLK